VRRAPQVVNADQREERAGKFKHDEIVGIQHQWPLKAAVEVALTGDVRDAERDDVREGQLLAHRPIVTARSDNAPSRRAIGQWHD
jgi:hypothetical protein